MRAAVFDVEPEVVADELDEPVLGLESRVVGGEIHFLGRVVAPPGRVAAGGTLRRMYETYGFGQQRFRVGVLRFTSYAPSGRENAEEHFPWSRP
jgi:hypothetical protein